jgi:Zn-dependent protease/predicted transcriptional regulator
MAARGNSRAAGPRLGRGSGLKLADVHGIEIRLDWSVAIVFALVVYGLGAGVFPNWHEDWGQALTWSVAIAAGLLFFGSLLAHELAHSVVAQLRGIPVPRITLFIFGGVSEMEREPDTPVTELLVAIVGPVMSIVLAIVFISSGLALAGDSFSADLVGDPQAAMASLEPAATLLLWLGPVNLILGVFNLIPGFPLDGGRVFRAVVWWATNDLERATLWAANVGRGFAWILMGFGVLTLLQGGPVQGIWFILIGWFLQNAATSSQFQLSLRQTITGLKVRDLMRTRFEVVGPELALETFLNDYMLRSGQPVWPVVDDEHLLGVVSFEDVKQHIEADGRRLTVRDAMRDVTDVVGPQTAGADALQVLMRSADDPLPVVDDGRLVGLLHRADIMLWLAAHQLHASGAGPERSGRR